MESSKRISIEKTKVLVAQFRNDILDSDDAYIFTVNTNSDLFPNVTDRVLNTPLVEICTLSGICDSTDVYWKYTGDNWYANSLCFTNFDLGNEYRGNYGICHNGASNFTSATNYSSSSFAGNRNGYLETKLWGLNIDSKLFQEKIFYK